MSLPRNALLAVLDAFPWAVLAAAGTYLALRGNAGVPPLLIAELVGIVVLAFLGTVSANAAQKHGKRFQVSRWIVDQAVFGWP